MIFEQNNLVPLLSLSLYMLMSQYLSIKTIKLSTIQTTHQTLSYDDHASIHAKAYERQSNVPITIEKVIGEGGMGIVYLGHQSHPNRDVAIKRLKKPNRFLGQALYREAMITGSLSHPTIIPIYMLNLEEGSSPEVVMKRIEGQTILEIIDNQGSIDNLRKVLNAIQQVCNGLEYAHSKGIIHRDIKPENIMLGEFGEVYILDWGVAAQKEQTFDFPNVMVGTPAYMAPEMLHGDIKQVDERTDVYLLGATLHHILTGEVRHTAETMEEITQQILQSTPYQYDDRVPLLLAHLANQACHPDPEKRIQSPAIFRHKLQEFFDYSQAFSISDAAQKELNILKQLLNKKDWTDNEKSHIQQHYNRSRFGFEQALDIWPEFRTAKKLLQETKLAMVSFYLSHGNLEAAKPLIGGIEELPYHLRVSIERLKTEQNKQKNEIEQYRRIQKKKESSTLFRVYFAIGILSVCFIMMFFLFQVDDIDANNLHPETLFLQSVTLSLPLIPLMVFGRSRFLVSPNARRAAIAIVGVVLTIVLHRWIAMEYQELPTSIIVTDLFIVGFGLSNTAPSILYGKELGLMCIIIGVVNHNFPITFWFGTLVLIVVLGICVYGDWTRNWNEPNTKKRIKKAS